MYVFRYCYFLSSLFWLFCYPITTFAIGLILCSENMISTLPQHQEIISATTCCIMVIYNAWCLQKWIYNSWSNKFEIILSKLLANRMSNWCICIWAVIYQGLMIKILPEKIRETYGFRQFNICTCVLNNWYNFGSASNYVWIMH